MPLWRRDRHRREAPPPPRVEPQPEFRALVDAALEVEEEPPGEAAEPSGEVGELAESEGEPSTSPVEDAVPAAAASPVKPHDAAPGPEEAGEPPAEPASEGQTEAELPAPVERPEEKVEPSPSGVSEAPDPEPGPTEAPAGEPTEEPEPGPAVTTEARPRRPTHARLESADGSFTERAQLAMERLGEMPTTNGSPKVRPLPRVVAIANQKGGVGKTTTTVNLGAALSELDYRVLVVDLDPQGNATSGLGIDTRNFESSMYDVIMRDAPIEDCIEPTSVQNLFVTPATIDLAGVEIELVSAFSRELKLKRAIETVVDDFDFVLIDCPPSLGLLTINGLAAASEVLVPIQCEYYALEGLSQLIRNVQLVASNLNSGLEISAIVLTMFDARTRLAIEVADEVRNHFREVVCRSIIPRTVRLSEAPSFGQPITVFDPSSRGAVAYRELAKEVSDGAPKRSG
jgi:chromosome partitioning protein